MVSRLVLGCGSVGQRFVESISEYSGSLLVITEDSDVVETLRDDTVPAEQGDPTELPVMDSAGEPHSIIIASDRSATNRKTLEATREVFPAALVVVYAGENPTPEDREVFDRLADRVVDPDQELANHVLEQATDQSTWKAFGLRRILSTIEGRLGVFMHDNPDPDAIASAVAFTTIAESIGIEAQACYFGEISHQENRAMVNALDLPLTNLDAEDSLEQFSAFALVDHSRPGVNNQLPKELQIDVVIDHHPPRGPVPGTFVDLRDDAGSTSTVMTEYLDRFGIDIDRRTATALLYGIRVDTNDFMREVSPFDFWAASRLLPYVDDVALSKIETPTIEGETLDTIARAIKTRTQRDSVVVSNAGVIGDRDALPQAAEQLLNMEGVDTTLVFGFLGEMVYLSARSRAGSVDLGETLREAFGAIGSAGGHADMAGAQLEIGILAGEDEQTETVVNAVEAVITNRFFEAIQPHPAQSVGSYSLASEVLFSTDVDEGDRKPDSVESRTDSSVDR